jgi:hypothetical protein
VHSIPADFTGELGKHQRKLLGMAWIMAPFVAKEMRGISLSNPSDPKIVMSQMLSSSHPETPGFHGVGQAVEWGYGWL